MYDLNCRRKGTQDEESIRAVWCKRKRKLYWLRSLPGFIRQTMRCRTVYWKNFKSVTITEWYEPWHDKTNKMSVCPVKTRISLGIRPVWSECSLSAWRKLGSLTTHWVHSEDSDQTGRMPRLIWVFALSCCGSYFFLSLFPYKPPYDKTNKMTCASAQSDHILC